MRRVGLTPTIVSVISIGWRLLAIAAFADDRLWLGAAAYVIGLLLDGVDGKLARLTGRTSALGAALDYSADMGLFAALTLSLGVSAGSPLWLIGACIALGVASALAPSPLSRMPRSSARTVAAGTGGPRATGFGPSLVSSRFTSSCSAWHPCSAGAWSP